MRLRPSLSRQRDYESRGSSAATIAVFMSVCGQGWREGWTRMKTQIVHVYGAQAWEKLTSWSVSGVHLIGIVVSLRTLCLGL